MLISLPQFYNLSRIEFKMQAYFNCGGGSTFNIVTRANDFVLLKKDYKSIMNMLLCLPDQIKL